MSEFCPRCTAPIEPAVDHDRLCETCGWFGDRSEVLAKPPCPTKVNPILAMAQCLELYREVCRNELAAEQLCQTGGGTEADIAKVRAARRQATGAVLDLLAGLQKLNQPSMLPAKRRILREPDGTVPWPAEWASVLHFNSSNKPCDALVGPCSCGAWHDETEPWVQDLLKKHNAEIVDE